jgi:hypothetical protein
VVKFRAVPEAGFTVAPAETLIAGTRLVTAVPWGTVRLMVLAVLFIAAVPVCPGTLKLTMSLALLKGGAATFTVTV